MMRTLMWAWAAAAMAAPAWAQDPVKVEAGRYTLAGETERLRVLRISIPAGAKGLMHEHPDAIMVFLTDAKMRFTLPDGTTAEGVRKAGEVSVTRAGRHLPENVGGAFEAVMVELKPGAPPPAATPSPPVPTASPAAASPGPSRRVTRLVSSGRAEAVRMSFDAGFREATHTHEFDLVAVPMADADEVKLTIGSRTARFHRGEPMLIPSGTPHALEAGAAAEAVVVFVR